MNEGCNKTAKATFLAHGTTPFGLVTIVALMEANAVDAASAAAGVTVAHHLYALSCKAMRLLLMVLVGYVVNGSEMTDVSPFGECLGPYRPIFLRMRGSLQADGGEYANMCFELSA
ncbi:unnamed protein product [Strongylus vulgaris]|uniref:Uncharacterized protein n=1 Tax=Strongylus vulgaris TaxID=40348 RepID=A0A3P7LLZ7_STRVU|nr:unnamed protein product [Strongylus vulgaris]